MKLVVFLLVVMLLLGGLVGKLAGQDPGYVLIAFREMSIETSLWFAIAALAVALVALRLVYLLLLRTLGSRRLLGRWFRARSSRTAEERTAQGMLMLAEDEWSEAKRLFSASAKDAPVPLVNHLAAARAAHELGQAAERDQFLDAAEADRPGAAFAVLLARAEMQVEAGNWEGALASLLELKSRSPRHGKVQRLLADTYLALEDWAGLAALLPGLRKSRSLPPARIDALHEQVLIARLDGLGAAPDQIDLREALWKKTPKALRGVAAVVQAYVNCAVRQGNADAAEAVVRTAAKRAPSEALMLLYSIIPAERLERQLQTVDAWQSEQPNSAAAKLAMGRLRLRQEDWERARESFEASLKLEPTPLVYAELGRLCCALGDVDRGSEYLKVGLPGLPELPLPRRSEEAPSLAEVVASAAPGASSDGEAADEDPQANESDAAPAPSETKAAGS
ncbi:MAG: heme biosynthesis HemY N-terminal domain-containing protein [Pseudomonadota bacterium]